MEYGHRLKHLDAFFAGRRVATIRGADATDYTVKRQGQGASGGTIRRELSTLNRMLTLAYDNDKIHRLPKAQKAEGWQAPPGVPRTRAVRQRVPPPSP